VNLDLAAIREGAMNPPAGTARQYEDMFARQLEQAAADERRLRREGMEAAMQRALDRSGLYNVGSMMIPQDAGEVALGLAMTPGIGMGLRTALAGLGGMTTQIGDAEGAMVPRSWFENLLRSRLPAARQEGQRGLDTLSDASRGINIDAIRFASGEDQNRIFQELASDTWGHGWLPFGNDRWLGAMSPGRELDFTNLDAAWTLPGRVRSRTENLVYDPVYHEAADRALNVGHRGRHTVLEPNVDGGWYDMNNSGDLVVGRLNSNPRDTFWHELQHSAIDRAGLHSVGNTVDNAWSVNPNLREEYIRRSSLDPLSAAENMYYADPGEWLARLNERLYQPNAVVGDHRLLADPFARWPDFRIR
jgi:hypothetical protein